MTQAQRPVESFGQPLARDKVGAGLRDMQFGDQEWSFHLT
jgi:hypothetical protein